MLHEGMGMTSIDEPGGWRILGSIRPPPPGISALGYLLISARMNGYQCLGELRGIRQLLGRSDREPLVAAISEHTGLDPDTVGRMGLRRAGSGFVTFESSVIRDRHMKARLRICPTCFALDGIHRAVWDLALIDACPLHLCPLQDRCPACGQAFAWKTMMMGGCGACGASYGCSAGLTRHDVRGTALVYRLFGDDRCALDDRDLLGWLSEFPLAEVLDFLRVLSIISTGERTAKDVYARHPSLADRRRLLGAAFDCLADWPQNFHAMLDRTELDPPEGDQRPSLYRCWPLMHVMLESRTGPGVWRALRHAVDNYFLAKENFIINRKSIIHEKLNRSSNTISAKEAGARLGISAETVKALIERGVLNGQLRPPEHPWGCHLVSAEGVWLLKRELGKLASTAEARQILGVRRDEFEDLVKAGALSPRFKRGTLFGNENKYFRPEIFSLIRKIKNTVVTRPNCQQTVTLKKVMRNAILFNRSTKQVFEGILSMTLCPCMQTSSKNLLHRFLFDAREAKRFLRRLPDEAPGDRVPRKQAMKRLKISAGFMSALVATGMLKRAPCVGGAHLFHRSEIERFRKTWIHLEQVTKRTGLSRRKVLTELSQMDVRPAWEHTSVYGCRYVLFALESFPASISRRRLGKTQATSGGRPKASKSVRKASIERR
jgi:hypothetical protein